MLGPVQPLSDVPRTGLGVPSPMARDAITKAIGRKLSVLFCENDQTGFIEAVPPSDSALLLWGEAEYVLTNLAEYENILPTVQSRFHADTPANEKIGYIWHGNVPGTVYEYDLDRFSHQLPGTGDAYDLCGYVFPGEAKMCLNLQGHALNPKTRGLAYAQVRGCSCGRLSCPVCYHRAILREAGAIENQFKRMADPKGRDPYAEAPTKWGKPGHWTVSPSHEDRAKMTTRAGIAYVTNKSRQMLKKVGFFGGVEIGHPYRQDKLLKNKKAPAASPDMSYDETKAYSEAHGWANDGSWYTSQHSHYIGYHKGAYAKKVEQNYEDTGYVVKFITTCNSVFGTVFYQLTHAGVMAGKHTVKWLGIMSNGLIGKNAFLDEVPKKVATCPECKQPLKRYVFAKEVGNCPIFGFTAGDYWLSLDPDDWVEVRRLHCEHTVEHDSTLDESLYSSYELEDGGGDWVPLTQLTLAVGVAK